jgi:hypothetical protein
MQFLVCKAKNKAVRIFSLMLVLCILCALLPLPSVVSSASSQDELIDIKAHWAESVIRKWVSYGLAKGYGDGRFGPNDNITRAEFVTLLNRLFGYEHKSERSFPDVKPGAWYAAEIAKAYQAGIISGDNKGNMSPEAVISRQEAVVILTRAFSLTGDHIDAALKYADVNQIAEWALGAVGTMTKRGYVTGRPGNLFAPKANLSRAEAVKMIDNVVGELINTAGTYTRVVPGNMVVSSPGITLKDTYIAGDLYLTEGIGNESIQLIDVEIKGRTIVADGVDMKSILTSIAQGDTQSQPTLTPTSKPATQPTNVPGSTTPTTTPGSSTPDPTTQPTTAPTPTQGPTATPTQSPTATPTQSPTATPTQGPTASPTPTQGPTATPNPEPTVKPTDAPVQKTDHIEQFGVTWYFDKEYEYGQFVNGDYWVIGPVNIVRITPETTQDPAMNGSMINPLLSSIQGYDDRSSYAEYSPELNVAAGISSSSPLVIRPGSSLVSSSSKPTVEDRPIVDTAAVLTVLDKTPPAGSFRPPYTGTDKSIQYNTSQINYQLLQNLSPTANMPSVSSVIAYFERPWIDHAGYGLMAQFINPDRNIGGYGAVISPKTSLGLLMANTDIPADQKERLVICMVQAGIDLYGLYMDRATSRWAGGGGHNTGRLGLILFAGMMLQDEGMMNIYGSFQEVDQTYYGNGWSGATVLWRGRSIPEFEYEHKHPSEWTVDGRGEPGDPKSGSNSDMRIENYRQCCNAHTWVGTALAFRLMNGMAVWNHPAYFDYIDRWMTEDWSSYAQVIREETGNKNYSFNQGGTSHKFITEMWKKYRDSAPFVSVYPKGGLYSQSIEVQLNCEHTSAKIYYTLDGTEPTKSSYLYQSPLLINKDCVVSAKAFLDNGEESPVSSVQYQIADKEPPEVEHLYYDPDSNRITICFSEKISEEGLEQITFAQSSENNIKSVNLQEDRKTVIVETSPLDVSLKHILRIPEIKDLMDPANISEERLYEINIHEIFTEDFESETLYSWQYRSPERWVIEKDEDDTSLRLKSSYYSPTRKPGEYVILQDTDCTDFVVELDGKLTDSISDNFADFCVIFGYRNDEDYYFVAVSRSDDEAGIYKVVGQAKYLLYSISPIPADNNYHKAKVSVVNNMITVYVDGVQQGIIQNRVQNGKIGFGTMNDPAKFDNFRLKVLHMREKVKEVE